MANIKSQIKRNRQNEKRRMRNKSVKSSLKTVIRKFHEASDAGDAEQATVLLRAASRQLDKAVSKTPAMPSINSSTSDLRTSCFFCCASFSCSISVLA